jgi:hypothetical protein
MPATLTEVLLAPENRPQLTDDCQALIEQQVSDVSGISGAAVKIAYKTVKAFMPGYLRHMVESLLPEMVTQLEPFWADFQASGGDGFGDYLAKRGDEASEALLSITDEHGARSDKPTIVRAYNKVRPSAARHVTAALPAVGALVQKHAG